MNYDFRSWPTEEKRIRTTRVLLPERVARDFRSHLGTWEHLEYLEHLGAVTLEVIPEGESVDVDRRGPVGARARRLDRPGRELRGRSTAGQRVELAVEFGTEDPLRREDE